MAARIAASRQQVSCDLDGEVVVLQLEDGEYYGLRGVAADLWRWLQTPTTRAELVDRLVEAYDVEPARAGDDLAAFLSDLEDAGLVRRA